MSDNLEVMKALEGIEGNICAVKSELDANKVSSKAFEDKLKELGDKQVALAKQLQDTAQSIDDSLKANEAKAEEIKSLGEKAASSAVLKNYTSGSISFDVNKAITSGASNSITRTTITPAYQAGMVTMPDAPIDIESLFPSISINVDAIEYLKEGSVTDGSKVVAEGGKLGETTATAPSLYTANAVNIGAYATVTHQLITNESAFAQYINTKMQYKLQLNVNNQLINGAGGATALGGLLLADNHSDVDATVLAKLPKSGATLFDFALLLKTEFEKQYIAPERIILNPDDWVQLAMLKDTKGNYLLGGPQALASKTLWGVPVLTTQVIPSGKYILGNFNLGATIYNREAINFRISDQDGENFKSMLYTLRVYRRMAFVVENPKAIFAGNFSLTASEG